MGFFDVFKKVVLDFPLVKKIAGVVAHAVPFVGRTPRQTYHIFESTSNQLTSGELFHLGPVIDVAVPALDAIFSNTPDTPKSEEQGTVINFEKNGQALNDILAGVKALKDNIESLGTNLSAEIEKTKEDIVAFLKHDKYLEFKGKWQSNISFFNAKITFLQNLTAASGESEFEVIFGSGQNFDSERVELSKAVSGMAAYITDSEYKPSEELLGLYLVAAHWVLLFDKTLLGVRVHISKCGFTNSNPIYRIIICQGLKARSLYVSNQPGLYLIALGRLKSNIGVLRQHAKDMIETLKKLKENLVGSREGAITIERKQDKVCLIDKWPAYAIGHILPSDLSTVLDKNLLEQKIPEGDTKTDAERIKAFGDTPPVVLYKTIAVQQLDSQLKTIDDIIAEMQLNIENWNNRLPVSPAQLSSGSHVTAKKPFLKVNDSASITSSFWEQDVCYAVTYTNSYGESNESPWSNSVNVEKGTKEIELEIHPVSFEGDPTAKYASLQINGKPAASAKGITRTIYAKFTENGVPKYHLVGQVTEEATTFVQKLILGNLPPPPPPPHSPFTAPLPYGYLPADDGFPLPHGYSPADDGVSWPHGYSPVDDGVLLPHGYSPADDVARRSRVILPKIIPRQNKNPAHDGLGDI
ncbi:hypothetical protein EV426DRAFT_712775 [Tirmania nivea]|nr:hypothetical protein EV426DRAFT_712775 [Tirmania nivea]